MKNFFSLIFTFLLGTSLLFSQQSKTSFEVHQLLYYENENCSSDNHQNKYAVIYQNFYDQSQYIAYNLKSFNDQAIILYFINQNKVIHHENYPLANFNAASNVELVVEGIDNLNDLDHLPTSKIKLKFFKKENLIKEHRMLTAYYFKSKNFENVKEVIYYIDHGSSGTPFSYHATFYDEMRKENFPLIGNVVQRDEVSKNGTICSFFLKSIQQPNKKFSVIFP